jgi:hypothetical protein
VRSLEKFPILIVMLHRNLLLALFPAWQPGFLEIR